MNTTPQCIFILLFWFVVCHGVFFSLRVSVLGKVFTEDICGTCLFEDFGLEKNAGKLILISKGDKKRKRLFCLVFGVIAFVARLDTFCIFIFNFATMHLACSSINSTKLWQNDEFLKPLDLVVSNEKFNQWTQIALNSQNLFLSNSSCSLTFKFISSAIVAENNPFNLFKFIQWSHLIIIHINRM